jgi:IS66 Orf2 like protein
MRAIFHEGQGAGHVFKLRFRNVYLFQQPISMRWGERKLAAVCEQHLGVGPKIGDAFVFWNRKRDQLKIFYRDEMGSNDMSKRMPAGGFVLPAPNDGEHFVKLSPKLIPRIFSR